MSNKINIIKYALLVALVTIFMSGGCTAKRPVLYPNDRLKEVGLNIAQEDIDYCINQANEYVGRQRPVKKLQSRLHLMRRLVRLADEHSDALQESLAPANLTRFLKNL